MKQIAFLLLSILCACSSDPCGTAEKCAEDRDCLCWCSQICNFRKKTSNDHPFWVENDPNGKFCYCKKWDWEHYDNNCILHKGDKEPPDAD